MPGGDLVLVLGASLRLTRFVVTDSLGERIKGAVRDTYDPPPVLSDALDCPWCVGTWLGYGVLASYALARHGPHSLALWRYVAGGLLLNEATAHIGSRIGDY